MSKLTLEVNPAQLVHVDPHPRILITPAITPDFWHFRVPLSDKQALVAFPKFNTIGIGFQHEEDWNTNLPYACKTRTIFDHIKRNKGDDQISDELCVEAIAVLQEAAYKALGPDARKIGTLE